MLTDLEKNAIRDHYQNIGKTCPVSVRVLRSGK